MGDCSQFCAVSPPQYENVIKIFMCGVSPFCPLFLGAVLTQIICDRCPPLSCNVYYSPHQESMCGVPPPVALCLCHTLICLGFSAKLKIWQAPTCKFKPQIFLCILHSVDPSWIINLAQLVSPSAAQPAELVYHIIASNAKYFVIQNIV